MYCISNRRIVGIWWRVFVRYLPNTEDIGACCSFLFIMDFIYIFAHRRTVWAHGGHWGLYYRSLLYGRVDVPLLPSFHVENVFWFDSYFSGHAHSQSFYETYTFLRASYHWKGYLERFCFKRFSLENLWIISTSLYYPEQHFCGCHVA